jgi:hypothetical protein
VKVKMVLALGLMLAVGGTAGAVSLQNGSFEQGLTGWSTQTSQDGSVTVVSRWENWLPTDGRKFALLTTGDWQLCGQENWQLLCQTPTLAKGSQVSFDWFFDQDEWLFDDYARIKLNGVIVEELRDDTPGECAGNWMHYISAPLPQDGAYTIEFGVKKDGGLICSHMGVDDVQVTSTVPEPVTMLGIAAGIGGIGAYLRKRAIA